MRIGHCRGFGIQSPTDYRFVCNVVNDRRRYPAYADLERSCPALNRDERRLYELYYRMASLSQPGCVVDWREGDDAFARYVHAGCATAQVACIPDGLEKVDFLRIDAAESCASLFGQSIAKVHGSSVMVVEGIKRSREARRFWRSVVADERVGVTFDLYYAGVAFFDKARYKTNYIVNF